MAPMPFVAQVTATLTDNFPLASKKNPGDTINYTAVITNNTLSDVSAVAYTDTLDNNTTQINTVRVSPVTVNDSYTCTGNVQINVPVGSGVLANDYLGQNPAVTTVAASDTTSTQGGTVTVNADGSFTYNPPANFSGADTFTYTLTNVAGSSVGTVTINVSDRILFVASGGVGNCKPATPCSLTFADGLAAPSSGKDLVFVESGTYSSAAISLNSGQTIAGQKISIGTALTDAGITLAPNSQTLNFPASTTPALNNAGTIVTLGGNNLVEDLSINPTAGNGILGTSITTGATIRDLTLTGAGAANGINFTGTSTGSTFNLSNIGVTTAGGNALSDVGSGGVTTGGTINATQNNTSTVNTLTSTTGIALQLTNTTIGASGVTFRSISAGTGADSAGNGIVLDNTGSSGGLTVTGNGSTCTFSTPTCDGGTIQHKNGADNTANSNYTTGIGIYLNSTSSVSLTRMHLHDFTNYGIRGRTVSGFTLQTSVIDGANGDNATADIDGVGTGGEGEGPVRFTNLTGSGLIDSCFIGGGFANNVLVSNNTGTLNRLTISNSTIGDLDGAGPQRGLATQPQGGNIDVFVESAAGISVMNTTISNNTLNYGVSGIIQVTNNDSSNATHTMDAVIRGNTMINSNPPASQVTGADNVSVAGLGTMTYDISCNKLQNSKGIDLNVFKGGGSIGTLTGTIYNNTLGATGVVHSGGGAAAAAINVDSQGTGTHTVLIKNNNIRRFGEEGIRVNNVSGNSTLNATIIGNTVLEPDTDAFTGLFVVAGADPVTDSSDTSNVLIGGSGAARNDFSSSSPGTNGVFLEHSAGVMNLSRGVSVSSSSSQIVIDNNNVVAGNVGTTDPGPPAIIPVNTTPTLPPSINEACSPPPIAQPDDGGIAKKTQTSNPTSTGGGSSASPTMFAWLQQVLHPVAAFASTLNFLRSSEAPTDWFISPRVSNPDKSRLPDGRASAPSAANSIAPTSKPVVPFSGELISFSLPVVLNVGKSVTIKYDATVNTPPGGAFVQTQGNVTFTGGPGGGVNTTDPETGTVVPTKTNINTTLTWVGGTSTDWNTAANWDFNYTPQTYSDVVVPNVGAQPNIGTSPTINSFNIASGRTLTLPGQTLTISGGAGSDMTLNGIISGGAVQFAAGGPHLLSGTGSLTNGNLFTIPSPAAVTLQNNLQVAKLTINSGGSFDITNRTLSLSDNLINNGTFTLTGSTVIFNGTGAQTLTNTTAFNNLTINNSGGSVTLGSNATVNGTLTLTSDLMTSTFTLTMPVAGIISGGGDVVGNLTRNNGGPSLPTATNITFGNPNTLLNFVAQGTVPTSINFRLTKTAPTDAATGGTNTGFPNAVTRTWLITQTGGSGFKATMQLHYSETTDLNGNVETNHGPGSSVSLRLYKLVPTGWQQQDFPNFANTTIDTTSPGNHFVKYTNVTGFSPWTIGGVSPTAATSTVSGRIVDDQGNPVEGAVVRLEGTQNRKTITDSQGSYNFAEVETNGFYTITPSRVNYNFAPATRGFSALGAHTEASFGAALNGNHQNPLDTTEYFVRQQYVDFLNREPEEKGFNDWTDTINSCAAGDASCDRVHVSEMFFRSEEFQQRGYFVYRFYSVAFGQKPDYAAFAPDLQRVSGFLDTTQLEAAKNQFASDFTSRATFINQYGQMTNSQYVDALAQTAGVNLSNRQALVDSLESGTLTRAQALRQIVESGEVYSKYYNQAFVVMEYFGYLRRDPDALYLNWISVLDANPADSRHMVEGFVDATEYRNRFKQ